ncbi:MAG: hypothetical protein CR979_02065 [Propionibacterium sp.]|nr:MAG: hypothetical protein CR979_02065 [Propionibacterium sp.]
MIVITAFLAGITVFLLLPATGKFELSRLTNQGTVSQSIGQKSQPVVAALLGVSLVLAGVVYGLRLMGWLLAGSVIIGTISWLIIRSNKQRKAKEATNRIIRFARLMNGKLRIGLVPVTALVESATECGGLDQLVATAKLGGDIPAALRQAANIPGQSGLRQISAAWELSQHSGAPIAGVLDRIVAGLRQDAEAEAELAIELAAARTTGRIMSVLPLAAIGFGYLAGANPIDFITSNWVGELAFVSSVLLAAIGIWWLEKMATRALEV